MSNQEGSDPGDGVVVGWPRLWLVVEGLVLLVGSLIAFSTLNESWWLVPAAILAPDLAVIAYLGGTRVGAHIYNAVHATVLPAAVLGLGYLQDDPVVTALALVWLAHIGLDRLLGQGLKYDDRFPHTHLGSGRQPR